METVHQEHTNGHAVASEEKEVKEDRYIALFKDSEGNLQYVTANRASQLNKKIAEVPQSAIVCVWKGKKKTPKLRMTF